MSRDGVYSPFKPINADDRDFGVKVTDRYKLGQHSQNFSQGPVTSIVKEDREEELWLYGWSYEPESDDTYMYSSHYSWSMSKLYHTYMGGDNFTKFWTTASKYCEPFRILYTIRHGSEFQDLAEITYGGYTDELFEVFTDGSGGYILVERDLDDIKSSDQVDIIENQDFQLDLDGLL